MQDALSVLGTYFGYNGFRPGQEPLIDALLSGRDAVGIMPTGAGKSLCFQVPALLLDGVTLVVSPLISLMKDQVNALTQAGIAAAYLNSTLTPAQQARVLENAGAGRYKILYVAPERLAAPDFLCWAGGADIPLLAVDEAHCVSQWGQDFRPSYLRIGDFIAGMACRPVLGAFTATATAQVREDMIRLLGLRDPYLAATGFDRENLFFEVRHPRDKYKELRGFLAEREDKSGIIYCLTRKTVEEVCERLQSEGLPATRYHAGLGDRERRENQDAFQADDARVMVATNAFGMGIDKSNVSFVAHYNMPKNMEGYYQEAGRAGRDGSPADCLLLYGGKDVVTNQFLIDKGGDTEELAGEELELFRARERDRLRQMTFYCHTQDCLRGYILRYFGERAPAECGNCGNCLSTAEKVDVTVDAQKILSCVKRMGERFGTGLVVDTLRGSKNARVQDLGFQKLTTYGIMSGVSAARIREIINFLVLRDYLTLTNSEYPVLTLGPRAKGVLFGGEALAMNAPRQPKEAKEKEARPSRALVKNPRLYSMLHVLRAKLAATQSVPAFVIFSDASLRDMCQKLPLDDESFLSVSGVGQAKLARYGKAFLEVIRKEAENRDRNVGEPIEVDNLSYRESLAAQGVTKAFGRWTDDEDDQLREEFHMELSYEEIGKAHGRTPRAIEMRLEKLGLVVSSGAG